MTLPRIPGPIVSMRRRRAKSIASPDNHLSLQAAQTVLIISHRQAQEVDGVIDLLRSFGVTVARWNLCEFPEHSMAITTHNGVTIDAHHFDDLVPVASWLHETGDFTVAKSLSGLPREVALSECEAFCSGLLARFDTRWLNHPSAIHVASNKLFQLATAKKLGLPIPDYCATNDPNSARSFVESKNGVIAKAVRGGFIVSPDTSVKFFTRRVADLGPSLFDQLRYGPVIFQEEVPKQLEVRVTVVETDCYSMEVDCGDLPQGVVDIRQLHYESQQYRFRKAR